MPEIRIDLDIASEADGAVREGEANGDGQAEGMIRIGERAGRRRGWSGMEMSGWDWCRHLRRQSHLVEWWEKSWPLGERR